jgi:hypothetical protein
MADTANPALTKELLELLSKHGVGGMPAAATAPAGSRLPGGAVASYIREIITSDVAFDEKMLGRVTDVLKKGSGN